MNVGETGSEMTLKTLGLNETPSNGVGVMVGLALAQRQGPGPLSQQPQLHVQVLFER